MRTWKALRILAVVMLVVCLVLIVTAEEPEGRMTIAGTEAPAVIYEVP